MKKSINFVVNFFKGFLIAILVLAVVLLIFTAFNPVQNFKLFRVNSGSMEPVIKVGSVVLVQKIDTKTLKENDVITYNLSSDEKLAVTHRITEVVLKNGKTIYRTKGDANKAEDATEISLEQIKGKVIFSIPFLGYLSLWMRKPLGFILLIILPALLLIISEIINIKKTIVEEIKKKAEESAKTLSLFLITILSFSAGFFLIKSTSAYFTDSLVESNNTLTMGYWITPINTPTPTPQIANHLVINEVYFDVDSNHGSESTNEWIEIYNPTNSPVPFKNWQICDNSDCITINPTVSVPALGFALVSKNASTWGYWTIPSGVEKIHSLGGTPLALANTGDVVILKNSTEVEIDRMSWGTNISGFSSGCSTTCPSVNEGHSLERDPDGKDTNSASDFIDRSIPTPGS